MIICKMAKGLMVILLETWCGVTVLQERNKEKAGPTTIGYGELLKPPACCSDYYEFIAEAGV